MKTIKFLLLLLVFPLLSMSSADHKFYVSNTNIEYVKEKQSVQIITKIFIDDIEDVLQQRYNPTISLATTHEGENDAQFLKKYILEKLQIKINGKPAKMDYIGKEYDIDMVKAYIEITDVSQLQTIEIENDILFDLFPEQKNIVHFKSDDVKRSFVLLKDKDSEVINLR